MHAERYARPRLPVRRACYCQYAATVKPDTLGVNLRRGINKEGDTVSVDVGDEEWWELLRLPAKPFRLPARSSLPDQDPEPSMERIIQMYAAILREEPKPEGLTRAEEAVWDDMAAEIAAAPPDTPWHIPEYK